MSISLLFCGKSSSHAEPIGEKILYHLSLDRSFSYVCADAKKRERFLSVVSALTDDKEEIIYRQEIIKDFYYSSSLLEQLISMFMQFEELRISQKNAGKYEFRLSATKTASSEASKNILQTQALCLKRALLFVKGFGDLMGKYNIRSKGLKNFQNACRKLYETPEYSKLLTFCSKYENFSANGSWDFKFSINDEGRISEYELIDHRYIRVTDPEQKKKGFSLFKKAQETIYPCSPVDPTRDDFYDSLAISALSDISKLFSDLSKQIFARFGSVFYELDFYDVALKYIHALSKKNVPYCYPTFSADKRIRVQKLYDLYLLMSSSNPAKVIPNDFEMTNKSGGLLVFGNNGSGKTVYLRSIGTMQLLAQAGLPLPCETATITLFSQIATQFSEAEKEFCQGNDAGRFEQEVRELAIMVDTLKAGALVFLNETFQSTAYAEGAEGLYYLLKHFLNLNIRWVLVSHIRQLENTFAPDEVSILHTLEGYRIGK